MTEAGSIVEHSAINRGAFQDAFGVESYFQGAHSESIDREQLAEAIIKLVNEDRRVRKAIIDMVLACPNVMVQY